MNNPMRYVDPTGHFVEEYDEEYGYSTAGIVEEGDTLSNIALDIYGDEAVTEALANMNNFKKLPNINLQNIEQLDELLLWPHSIPEECRIPHKISLS